MSVPVRGPGYDGGGRAWSQLSEGGGAVAALSDQWRVRGKSEPKGAAEQQTQLAESQVGLL